MRMTPADFRKARQTLGLDQGQMADALGMSRSQISRMETGAAPIEVRTVLSVRAMLYLGPDPAAWPVAP